MLEHGIAQLLLNRIAHQFLHHTHFIPQQHEVGPDGELREVRRDRSVVLHCDPSELHVVDKVLVSENKDGSRLVRVTTRATRKLQCGDKLSCLTDDHEVLTLEGFKSIAALREGEAIATLDRDSNQMTYAVPSRLHCYEHDGELYEIETEGISLLTTLNHRMWVQKRQSRAAGGEWQGPFELIQADEVEGKRVRYQSAAPISSSGRLPVIPGLDITYINIEAFLDVFGIWIAEGWASEGSARADGTRYLHVAWDAHKPRVQQALEAAFGVMGWQYAVERINIRVHLHSPQPFCAYMRTLSVGAVNKRLPRWCFELSAVHSARLLHALILGDGSIGSTSLSYFTSSVGLRDDVQVLCQHAGFASYHVLHAPAGTEAVMKDGRIIKSTVDSWRVGIRKQRICPTVNHSHTHEQNGQTERRVSFKGKVYCVTVPTEVFLVRRRGRLVFTGNSRVRIQLMEAAGRGREATQPSTPRLRVVFLFLEDTQPSSSAAGLSP